MKEVESTKENVEILFVEDNEMFQKMCVSTLKALRFSNVTTAHDGKDALTHLNNHAVDLVISDCDMLPMDGLTLLREMRKDPAFANIPFILMSGHMSEDMEREAMREKATVCIWKKQVNLRELPGIIQKALKP